MARKIFFDGQVLADFLDGNVAGGAGGPHAAGHVDLAEGLIGHTKHVSHDVVLALVLAAGQLHAVLIEGSKAEASISPLLHRLTASSSMLFTLTLHIRFSSPIFTSAGS